MMPGLSRAIALDRLWLLPVPYEELRATVNVCRPLRIMSPDARPGRKSCGPETSSQCSAFKEPVGRTQLFVRL
jgi:hypothetical protein